MPEVIYRDNRGPAQRIEDRLRPSCPDYGRRPQDRIASNAEAQTVPNRCITTVYYGGSVKAHGNVKGGKR